MNVEKRRTGFATVALALGRVSGLYGYLAPLEFARVQSLQELGWQKSHVSKEAIDGEGLPIPWVSYAMIHFLEARDLSGLSVFEYGMGNSTRWWLAKGATVRAVDHHSGWYEKIASEIGAEATLIHRELGETYIGAVADANEQYDVVVVDGRERSACALTAVAHLSERGVIIWDDSDRERYQPAAQELLDRGFKKLPFRGISPIGARLKETSIYYRPDNALGI